MKIRSAVFCLSRTDKKVFRKPKGEKGSDRNEKEEDCKELVRQEAGRDFCGLLLFYSHTGAADRGERAVGIHRQLLRADGFIVYGGIFAGHGGMSGDTVFIGSADRRGAEIFLRENQNRTDPHEKRAREGAEVSREAGAGIP